MAPRIDPARYEEILTAAMLLGEPRPILCSLCMGAGQTKAIIGVRRCVQCSGSGFDYIGRETSRYAGLERATVHRRLDDYIRTIKFSDRDRMVGTIISHWRENEKFMRKYRTMDLMVNWVGRLMSITGIAIILWVWIVGRF